MLISKVEFVTKLNGRSHTVCLLLPDCQISFSLLSFPIAAFCCEFFGFLSVDFSETVKVSFRRLLSTDINIPDDADSSSDFFHFSKILFSFRFRSEFGAAFSTASVFHNVFLINVLTRLSFGRKPVQRVLVNGDDFLVAPIFGPVAPLFLRR